MNFGNFSYQEIFPFTYIWGNTRILTMTKALYRYPAEWEKQEATWLAFPHNKLNWHGERGVKIRKFYVELIRTISEFQPVNVLIPNKKFLTLDEKFAVADRPFPASFIICKTDDIWIRDYGPFFVKKGKNLTFIM